MKVYKFCLISDDKERDYGELPAESCAILEHNKHLFLRCLRFSSFSWQLPHSLSILLEMLTRPTRDLSVLAIYNHPLPPCFQPPFPLKPPAGILPDHWHVPGSPKVSLLEGRQTPENLLLETNNRKKHQALPGEATPMS